MLTEAKLRSMPARDYMNAPQQAFFKARLEALRADTQETIEQTKQTIAEGGAEADELDRAAREEDNRQRMRLAERQYYLLRKIDQALNRLAEGDYGYCRETGEPIGIERLLLRPTAELCIEAKTRAELLERNFAKARS